MTKKKVALITTTINVPIALLQYVRYAPEDVEIDVVVAGDKRTPLACQDFVEGELGGTYLGTAGENVERWKSHEMIGFNSIQRRNLALLHALANGAEFIITIDDDNVPVSPETYIRDMIDLTWNAEQISTDTSWWNPGSMYYDLITARGFPLSQRNVSHHEQLYVNGDTRIGVVQGMTTGDPDIDAVERITKRPFVLRDESFSEVVLNAGTWAPFNSQNTGYVRELAPLMQVVSGVGRYDDIWASYIARRVMDHLGWHVRYGNPVTFSERNEHDLITDLERELYGYRYTSQFAQTLRDIDISHTNSVLDALDVIFNRFIAADTVTPPRMIDTCFAWLHDVEIAMKEGENSD